MLRTLGMVARRCLQGQLLQYYMNLGHVISEVKCDPTKSVQQRVRICHRPVREPAMTGGPDKSASGC